MKDVKYVGPFEAVNVPALADDVERGVAVHVSDELAASLLDQPDNWAPAEPGDGGPKSMTKGELFALADELGIETLPKATKPELVAAIEAHQADE